MSLSQSRDASVQGKVLIPLAVLAVTSLTPIAMWGGAALVLIGVYGEMSRRRNVSVAMVVLSPLFVDQVLAGFRLHELLLGGLLFAGLAARLALGSRRLVEQDHVDLRGVLIPAGLVMLIAVNYVLRPPMTTEGRFSVFEQFVIFSLAAIFSIFPASSSDLGRVTGVFHWSLSALALVAGVDAILALSALPASGIDTRQVGGLFGASNYVAALLAVATIACAFRALNRREVVLNGLLCIAFVTLSLPHASRTSSIIVAVAFLIMLARKVRPGAVFLIVGVVFAGAPLLFSYVPAFARFQQVSNEVDSLNGRWTLWHFAVQEIDLYGLMGAGPGNLTGDLQASGSIPLYVHDVWLSWIVQYGVFALLAFALLMRPFKIYDPSGYLRCVALTFLAISTFEPVVETLKLGIVFFCLFSAQPAWPLAEELIYNADDSSRVPL